MENFETLVTFQKLRSTNRPFAHTFIHIISTIYQKDDCLIGANKELYEISLRRNFGSGISDP